MKTTINPCRAAVSCHGLLFFHWVALPPPPWNASTTGSAPAGSGSGRQMIIPRSLPPRLKVSAVHLEPRVVSSPGPLQLLPGPSTPPSPVGPRSTARSLFTWSMSPAAASVVWLSLSAHAASANTKASSEVASGVWLTRSISRSFM